MPIADVVIAAAIAISIVVGIMRGFVKETISIITLLVAIWAAMNFGAHAGELGERWIGSEGLRVWFGRALVFVVILAIGGVLGWGISRLMRLSALNGTDRLLGAAFGFCRGVVLLGVFVIGGQLASFDKDAWWVNSRLIPYGTVVADWIRVMAPKGVEMLKDHEPGEIAAELPVERT